jgi:hypothetical protein
MEAVQSQKANKKVFLNPSITQVALGNPAAQAVLGKSQRMSRDATPSRPACWSYSLRLGEPQRICCIIDG